MIIAMIPYCPRDEGTTPKPGMDFGYEIRYTPGVTATFHD